jgi:hypothetical protein
LAIQPDAHGKAPLTLDQNLRDTFHNGEAIHNAPARNISQVQRRKRLGPQGNP